MDEQIEIQNLAEAIAADPNNADLHYDLASVYHDAGQWQEAIREYLTVIDLNPSGAAAHNDLGLIYEQIGDSVMAEDTYRQAIVLDPQDATSYYNLGLLYQAQERIADARQELEQALALATDADEAQETQTAINDLSSDVAVTTQPSIGTVTSVPLVGKTFWPRAAAYIIDNLLLTGLSYGNAMVIGVVIGLGSAIELFAVTGDLEQTVQGVIEYVVGIFLVFAYFAYFVIFEALFGATPGKWILGMRVVREDGHPCGLRAALVRELWRIVDGIFCGLVAYGSMKNSSLQQRCGDKAAHTVVVSRRDPSIVRLRSGWGLVIALLLVFLMGTIMDGLLFASAVKWTPKNMIAVLKGEEWTTRARYDNFGFSIEYPVYLDITEQGFQGAPADEDSGQIGGESTGHIFVLSWVRIPSTMIWSSRDAVDGWLEGLEEAGNLVTRGEWGDTSADGNPVDYRFFEKERESQHLYGVAGSWYCEQNGRAYALLVLDVHQDILPSFENYLASFHCK